MYVYILQSLKDKRFYIGCSDNLEKRLERHNLGLVKSTRYRVPFVLVYKEDCGSYLLARRREIVIKKMKGGVQFKELLITAGVTQW